MRIGVQTRNVITDENPKEGFELLKQCGFDCCDFSLNNYLKNKDIYQQDVNQFFDMSVDELKAYFEPHKKAADQVGIKINQMHMPYPIYVPKAEKEVNEYLWNQVAPKSMELCRFFNCSNIVVHGFKLARYLGSEDKEWQETSHFIDSIAPIAKEHNITICIENLYDGIGGRLTEGPCCDANKAVNRIDEFNDRYGAEVLGFCFDVGHANIIGLDFEKFIMTLGKRLKVLHIHDNDGISDLHQIPFTFSRTRENNTSTNWNGFLKGLAGIGFDSVLSFETAPVLTTFPDEMKADALEFIAKIGKYFSKEIEKYRLEM